MLNARFFFGVAVVAGALVATSAAFGQEADTDYLLAQAERSYPESKIPVLFGPSSLSESFATEVDDPSWSSQTESRILDEVADHYADGLRYKRAQVECRTATCVLLLSYVAAPEGANPAVRSLQESLREDVGFTSAIKSEKTVMVQKVDAAPDGGMVRMTGVLAYVEIVLRAAR